MKALFMTTIFLISHFSLATTWWETCQTIDDLPSAYHDGLGSNESRKNICEGIISPLYLNSNKLRTCFHQTRIENDFSLCLTLANHPNMRDEEVVGCATLFKQTNLGRIQVNMSENSPASCFQEKSRSY